MQKFTRPLTREIELGSERLALTFSEQGLTVRPVGSRKPPREIGWPTLLYQVLKTDAHVPSAEELAAALETLRKGPSSKPVAAPPPELPMGDAGIAPASAEHRTGRSHGDVAKTLQRLAELFSAGRPRYSKGLLPAASEEQLNELQGKIGLALPLELRTLLSWHNGQSADFIGRFEQDWNLLGTTAIALAKEELDADAPNGWQKGWIPFLDNDAGDYLILDTNEPGHPVREFCLGKADHPEIASSLSAWLEDYVQAVERGEYTEDPERGSFLRQA